MLEYVRSLLSLSKYLKQVFNLYSNGIDFLQEISLTVEHKV